jgi:2-(1,2-epoxy-1,2-dihydrophenyl)acetyl-CoA isomerase
MEEATSGPVVLAEDHGQVRVLTLNRPARRNAIDLELRGVLAEAIEGAMADEAVRAVVLTGAAGPGRGRAGAPAADDAAPADGRRRARTRAGGRRR